MWSRSPGLSGDFNPIHTDVGFAKDTVYGQRVVYGLLGLSMLTGLLDRTGLFSGTRFRLTITDVRRSARTDRGVVQRYFELINQRDEVVQKGRIDILVRARGSAEA